MKYCIASCLPHAMHLLALRGKPRCVMDSCFLQTGRESVCPEGVPKVSPLVLCFSKLLCGSCGVWKLWKLWRVGNEQHLLLIMVQCIN